MLYTAREVLKRNKPDGPLNTSFYWTKCSCSVSWIHSVLGVAETSKKCSVKRQELQSWKHVILLTPSFFISGTDSEGKTVITASGQQEKHRVGTFE